MACAVLVATLGATPSTRHGSSFAVAPSPVARPSTDDVATPAPEDDPTITVRARAVFEQIRKGKLDRSGFTPQANARLTDQLVAAYMQTTNLFGEPHSFLYVGKQLNGTLTEYRYRISWPARDLDELVGLDQAGKVGLLAFGRPPLAPIRSCAIEPASVLIAESGDFSDGVPGQIAVYDRAAHRMLCALPVRGSYPRGVVTDARGFVYVADYATGYYADSTEFGSVSVSAPSGRIIHRITAGIAGDEALAMGRDDTLFVLNSGSGTERGQTVELGPTIAVYPAAALHPAYTYRVEGPGPLNVLADGTVMLGVKGGIMSLKADGSSSIYTHAPDAFPIAVDRFGHIFASSRQSGVVTEYDTSTLRVLRRIPNITAQAMRGGAIDQAGTLYVPEPDGIAVFPVDATTPSALIKSPLQNPYAVAFDRDDIMYVLYGGSYDPAARKETGKALAVYDRDRRFLRSLPIDERHAPSQIAFAPESIPAARVTPGPEVLPPPIPSLAEMRSDVRTAATGIAFERTGRGMGPTDIGRLRRSQSLDEPLNVSHVGPLWRMDLPGLHTSVIVDCTAGLEIDLDTTKKTYFPKRRDHDVRAPSKQQQALDRSTQALVKFFTQHADPRRGSLRIVTIPLAPKKVNGVDAHGYLTTATFKTGPAFIDRDGSGRRYRNTSGSVETQTYYADRITVQPPCGGAVFGGQQPPNVNGVRAEGVYQLLLGNATFEGLAVAGRAPVASDDLIVMQQRRSSPQPPEGYTFEIKNVRTLGAKDVNLFAVPDDYRLSDDATRYYAFPP